MMPGPCDCWHIHTWKCVSNTREGWQLISVSRRLRPRLQTIGPVAKVHEWCGVAVLEELGERRNSGDEG